MKKLLGLIILVAFIFSMATIVSADELITKTVNYKDNYYTFTFNNDLKTLDVSIKGFFANVPQLQLGNNVSKFWPVAGPSGAVVVWKVEPNSFLYAMIHYRTGTIDSKGYLFVDKYDVKDVKVEPTKYGALVTVYYVTGGDKKFNLKFKNTDVQL